MFSLPSSSPSSSFLLSFSSPSIETPFVTLFLIFLSSFSTIFQCAGRMRKTSDVAIKAPHANVAGACMATCNKRFTMANDRAMCSLLLISSFLSLSSYRFLCFFASPLLLLLLLLLLLSAFRDLNTRDKNGAACAALGTCG